MKRATSNVFRSAEDSSTNSTTQRGFHTVHAETHHNRVCCWLLETLGGNGMATLTNPLAEELEQQAVIAQDAHAGFHLVHYETPTGQIVWEAPRR